MTFLNEPNKQLPDHLHGRSIHDKVIPTVCNLVNMLHKLSEANWDASMLKQWEQRSYKAYMISEIDKLLYNTEPHDYPTIIKAHILSQHPSKLGASCIDIYLVAYVAETYGHGKDRFINYVQDHGISDKVNSANAIWQVGKGDGVYLDILNEDGTVKDWGFINRWIDRKPFSGTYTNSSNSG